MQTGPEGVRYNVAMSVKQYNNGLAEWAKEVVGSMTLRQAENKSGITYSTISNILHGRVPDAVLLIRFAAAFGKDIGEALRLAGYDDIAELWQNRGDGNTERNDDIKRQLIVRKGGTVLVGTDPGGADLHLAAPDDATAILAQMQETQKQLLAEQEATRALLEQILRQQKNAA